MSRSKAIRQSIVKPPVYRLRSDIIIRLLNSWVIQNEKIADFDSLPQSKQKARRFFEDQMRLAMCIAKNKPVITAKPQKPEKPYRGFYEFIHKMRSAATERGFHYLFARKLRKGSKIEMIDGTYTVENVVLGEEKGGYAILTRGNLLYHIEWWNNEPKFYYDKNDKGCKFIKEGLNTNSDDLDRIDFAFSVLKSNVSTLIDCGVEFNTDFINEIESAVNKRISRIIE